MIQTVTANKSEYKIFPDNELEEIAQNIQMILDTPKFSVPLFRQFGLPAELLDAPIDSAQTKLTAEIVSAVKEFEPRAKVTQVSYQVADTGKIIPTVFFKLA